MKLSLSQVNIVLLWQNIMLICMGMGDDILIEQKERSVAIAIMEHFNDEGSMLVIKCKSKSGTCNNSNKC